MRACLSLCPRYDAGNNILPANNKTLCPGESRLVHCHFRSCLRLPTLAAPPPAVASLSVVNFICRITECRPSCRPAALWGIYLFWLKKQTFLRGKKHEVDLPEPIASSPEASPSLSVLITCPHRRCSEHLFHRGSHGASGWSCE